MEYFKHDINANEDDKIIDLLANGGYELLGYYWRFIEYLYSRGGKASKKSLNGIAWSLHMDIDKLSTLICNFDLFYEDDIYIYSKRVIDEIESFEAVGKRMAEIGKAGGQASAQARAKRTVNHKSSECLSEDEADAQQNKKNKIKEKKINKIDKRECVNAPTHPLGKYKNVFLTDEEVDLLVGKFPNNWQDKIERLSKYMADTGKTYCSHYDTIVEWNEADAKCKNTNSSFDFDDFFEAALKKTYEEERL